MSLPWGVGEGGGRGGGEMIMSLMQERKKKKFQSLLVSVVKNQSTN